MLTPIATLVFAAAMALSLSVEAESFFHTPTKAPSGPAGEAEPADPADEAGEHGPLEGRDAR